MRTLTRAVTRIMASDSDGRQCVTCADAHGAHQSTSPGMALPAHELRFGQQLRAAHSRQPSLVGLQPHALWQSVFVHETAAPKQRAHWPERLMPCRQCTVHCGCAAAAGASARYGRGRKVSGGTARTRARARAAAAERAHLPPAVRRAGLQLVVERSAPDARLIRERAARLHVERLRARRRAPRAPARERARARAHEQARVLGQRRRRAARRA